MTDRTHDTLVYRLAQMLVKLNQAEVNDFVDECRLNQAVKGTVRVPGFGASDCTAACGAHLKYLGGPGE
jgi:Uri superfamily endonuclease